MKRNIIAVVSGKGGVGKSTVASLIGLALSRKKKKTLLVDADLGLTNLDIILKTRVSEYDLSDVINGLTDMKTALTTINPHLVLTSLCRKTTIANFDRVLNVKTLDKVIGEYDYIVLDAPAGIEAGFEFCINYATRIFIVINPEMSSLSDALKVESLIKEQTSCPYSFIINRTRRQEAKSFAKSAKCLNNSVSFCLKENNSGHSLLNDYSILECLARIIIDENQQELHI